MEEVNNDNGTTRRTSEDDDENDSSAEPQSTSPSRLSRRLVGNDNEGLCPLPSPPSRPLARQQKHEPSADNLMPKEGCRPEVFPDTVRQDARSQTQTESNLSSKKGKANPECFPDTVRSETTLSSQTQPNQLLPSKKGKDSSQYDPETADRQNSVQFLLDAADEYEETQSELERYHASETSRGIIESTNQEPVQLPGIIAIQGPGNADSASSSGDVETNDENNDENNQIAIAAEVAPDEEYIENQVQERLETQVQERLRREAENIVHADVVTVGNNKENDNSIINKRWVYFVCITVLLIIVGGVVGAVVASTGQSEPASTPAPTGNFTTWVQVGNDIEGKNVGNEFGSSVSISKSGDTVVVGSPSAPFSSDSRGPGNAEVYQYYEPLKRWQQIGQTLEGEGGGDEFGKAVAISGDGTTIAVGARLSDKVHKNGGSVYTYKYFASTNQWELLGGKNLTAEADKDRFGFALDLNIDGSIIAVSSSHYDVTNKENKEKPDAGRCYVYQYSKPIDEWIQLGQNLDGDHPRDYFGDSIALSDDGYTVAIGASQYIRDGKAGYVKILQYDSSIHKWSPLGNNFKLLGADQNATFDEFGERFGNALSISSMGNVVAIAAPQNDNSNGDDSGTVRIYKMNNETNNWEQIGQSIDGESADDWSGGDHQGVSLSNDGMIIAISSPRNDGANSDKNSNRGSTRIFEYHPDNNKWLQVSQDIDGESEGDESGKSISLSGDGSIVAIGAWWNDGDDAFNSKRGHVRLFRKGS